MIELKRGVRLLWQVPNAWPVHCEVTRVGRDGRWAGLECHIGWKTWKRRQSLPLSAGFSPCEWTQEDLDRQEEEVRRR